MQLTTTKFGFIKYDAHATCLVYFHFFSRSTVQRRCG